MNTNTVQIQCPQAAHDWGFHFDSLNASIVDFVSVKKKLVIELDGSQHLEQARFAYEAERSKYFESRGYKVVRFWNGQVENDAPAPACDLLGKSCKCCGYGPRDRGCAE